jgi:hypothetical protein
MQRTGVKHLAGGLSCVAILVSAGLVRADGVDPAAAEALFRDARRAAEAGDYAAACEKFAESQRLDPASGTLFNLADCEEHRGQVASAWEHFAQLVETLPAGDERREYARTHAGALEVRLPRLALTLDSNAPAGTKVTRDGIEIRSASLGVAVPLNPGAHEVRVAAPGRADRTYPVSLAEAQSLAMTVSAAPPPTVAGAAAPPVESPRRAIAAPSTTTHPGGGARTAGYVTLGVGGAALATGVAFGFIALAQRSTSDDDCRGSVCQSATGVTSYDHAKTSARIADVAFGTAAVTAGVGMYLVLSSHVDLAPSASRTGAGAQLRLAW